MKISFLLGSSSSWEKYFCFGRFDYFGQIHAADLSSTDCPTISQDDFVAATILVVVDLEKLNGYKDKPEKPTSLGLATNT